MLSNIYNFRATNDIYKNDLLFSVKDRAKARSTRIPTGWINKELEHLQH